MTTLLMIDDEELFLKSMARFFEGRGYRVIAEHHANRALARFDENPDEFDLVILDHDMPERSGRECLQYILARRPHIPVILMSGYPPEYFPAGDYEGVRIFLGKPMELSDVENAVRACLTSE